MEIRKIYSEFNTPVYLSKALNLYYGGWEICCPMHTIHLGQQYDSIT